MRAFREACRGITRTPGGTMLAIFGIAAALVMFGALGIITFGTHSFMDTLRQSEEINVYILETASDAEMLSLDVSIAAIPDVESTRIVSKENATREFERMFGKNLLSALDENPLPRSIVVTIGRHERTSANFDRIAALVEKMKGVESVEYGREWIGRMDMVFFLFFAGEIVLILLVSIAGILVISNSIGMTVVARRGEIEIMRLVGATGHFIRRPFYFEGAIEGFAAGILAFCALYGAFQWILGESPDLDVYLRILGFSREEFMAVGKWLAAIIPAGLILGLIGSFIAVRRDG
jgi:cell division transport system permease protein